MGKTEIELMMKNRIVFIGLITAIFTLNCEAQVSKFNYKLGTDFSAYKTYAWHPKMDGVFDGTVDTDFRDPENIQRVKKAVEKELVKKNCQQVDRNEADLHIAYSGNLEKIVT